MNLFQQQQTRSSQQRQTCSLCPLLSRARTVAHKHSSGPTSSLLNYIGQTVWQGVIGHKRQHMAPLACICLKSSSSIKQQDKILRESAGSGASCGCGCRAQEIRAEMKVRDSPFSRWHFSNVQLLPNKLFFFFSPKLPCFSKTLCGKKSKLGVQMPFGKMITSMSVY